MNLKNRGMLTVALLSAFIISGMVHAVDLPIKKLDQQFSKAQKDWGVPGIAIAIVKDDKVIFSKGYGVRKLNQTQPVDEHTLFAIASNSKAFTAATLAILVDQGKLKWDDKVVDRLPYFRLQDDYATREMTVRDLLSHRGGLGTFSGDLIWYGTDYSAEEVVKHARYIPTASSFRSHYDYSNVMFITAGEVVHQITGMPWSLFVKTNIIDKLAMTDTVLSVNELKNKNNVAAPHRLRDGNTLVIPWYRWDNASAAGGIISSVSDMSKWLRLQLNHGKTGDQTIFSEANSFAMWSPNTIIPISAKRAKNNPTTHFAAYGLGWSLKDYQGRKIVEHSGGYDGMYSKVVMIPEENLGIVVLTNSMTGIEGALANTIVDAALDVKGKDWIADNLKSFKSSQERKMQAKEKWVSERVLNTKPSLAEAEYAGTYGGAMFGNATVTQEDGKLVLRLLPNKDLVADLSHWHHDTYVLKWRQDMSWFDEGTVNFILDVSGKVSEMKIDVPNEDFWFTELEMKRLKAITNK
jgi:CubicO group peptidase (beta-lactamase class C family)